jgi:hypothetical protein
MQGNLKNSDFWRCGFCKNWCRVKVSYKSKEFIILDRCFWEERTTEVTSYKNNKILNNYINNKSSSNSSIRILET